MELPSDDQVVSLQGEMFREIQKQIKQKGEPSDSEEDEKDPLDFVKKKKKKRRKRIVEPTDALRAAAFTTNTDLSKFI